MQLAKGSPDEAIRAFFSNKFGNVREVQVPTSQPSKSAVFDVATQQGQFRVPTFLVLKGRTYQVLSVAGQGISRPSTESTARSWRARRR